MREEVHQVGSDEDSDSSHVSADAARLHAVARRIQLREHASRQQQLQLHKQLQQQQQLLQQQQQQLQQQDALLRHQEQLLRQQEQQLANRETEAGLLLRQVGLLQQQLEERADRLAAAEGNYLDAAALLQQLQQRIAMGAEARSLVEEMRQQQQQDSHHLYAEVRRLQRQLSLRLHTALSSDGGGKDRDLEKTERDRATGNDAIHSRPSSESLAISAAPADQQRQLQRADELSLSATNSGRIAADAADAGGLWCCAEAAEAAGCTAWGCSAPCCCCNDQQHETAVEQLHAALHECRSGLESGDSNEVPLRSGAAPAAGAAVLAVKEALHRCPAAGADAEIVDILLERLRAESMQIRVYAHQRRAAATAASGGSAVLQQQQQQQQDGGLAVVEEAMEREAYAMMGMTVPEEVLLLLLSVQSISTLLRIKQQSILLANSRWLQLLKDTAGSKFLEGSCCCSSASNGSSTRGARAQEARGCASLQLGGAAENGTTLLANSRDSGGERRQHVLLQLLLRGSGGVAAAAGLLRDSTAPLTLHTATLTDRESGNNVFHLLCLRNLPQLFGVLSLTCLPCELLYAKNRQEKTPADLLAPLLPPQLLLLQELQQAAAAGDRQQNTELQHQLSAISANLRAWRSVVFEYAAKAGALYRQHNNEAALSLYTEALKLQQRLLGKQQQLDEARSALRLGRWICSLQSCSLCLSMTPNYKAAYETAAEACEWLLDFEGALNHIQLMRQHCPEAFSAEHYNKLRLYEAQLRASSFQVLGVDRGAPKAAVNRAFRRMSILWHPDKASALSEDLRLRHENHFKRLNEARIALLDAESYARQLLVPSQPLYRDPELLVAPTPPQQSTPSSSFHVQPEQLTSEPHPEQQQLHQHAQQQDEQRETEQVEVSLEKLQQQRQQLLRSIESLQRQQHELQRELEEQQAAMRHRLGTSNASHSLRWQELQKLHQQQQNKQKRLAECEREISQLLHRRQQQQHMQQQQQQQDSQEKDGNEGDRSEQDDETSSSSPPRQGGHSSQQQQREQRRNSHCDNSQDDVHTPADGAERSPASQLSLSGSTAAASAATTAAAEVSTEAAAAAGAEQDNTKRVDANTPWTSLLSTDSDADDPAIRSVFQGDATTRAGDGSSSGSRSFPTATASLAAPAPSGANLTPSIQRGPSVSGAVPPAGTAAAPATRDTKECPRVCRTARRGGSRASSAGPQIRTSEVAAPAVSTATARRSLTACVCSAAPRRVATTSAAEYPPQQPKRNAAYWKETDSSDNGRSSESSESSESSGSSGSSSSDDDGRIPAKPSDKPWTTPNEYIGGRYTAAAIAAKIATAAAWPGIGSQVNTSSQHQHKQPLPAPPARRVPAMQSIRRNTSGSSAGSSNSKKKELPGRRRFDRSRGSSQQQQSNAQQHQRQQQEQRQRQQLWPGTGGQSESAVKPPSATPASATAAAPNSPAPAPQAAAPAACLRPPDFPEPFASAGRPEQQRYDHPAATPGNQQHNPQQQFCYLNEESIGHPPQHERNESERQKQPAVFASPVGLSHSVDLHAIGQQRLPQHHQPLQQTLHQQEEIQEACDPSRHQLLFPDEVLHYKDTPVRPAAATAAAAALAASLSRPLTTSPAEDAAAFFKSGWAAPGGCDAPTAAGHHDEESPLDRKYCWPVPSQCSVTEPDGGSSTTAGVSPGVSTHGARPTKDSDHCEDGCSTDLQKQTRASGSSSPSESCSSGNSSTSRRRSSNRSSSQCSRSDSATEESPGSCGEWTAGGYSQKQPQQQYGQQQDRYYPSVAQETHRQLRSPREADRIFLMQWGMGAPQRRSVPLLGRTSSGSNNSATLCKDAAASATPTRLFPQPGFIRSDLQQESHQPRFNGPYVALRGGECDTAAAAGASGGRAPIAHDETCGLGATGGTGNAATGGRMGLLRAEGSGGNDHPRSLGAWQPLLMRASLPLSRQEAVLHSPRRTPQI